MDLNFTSVFLFVQVYKFRELIKISNQIEQYFFLSEVDGSRAVRSKYDYELMLRNMRVLLSCNKK